MIEILRMPAQGTHELAMPEKALQPVAAAAQRRLLRSRRHVRNGAWGRGVTVGRPGASGGRLPATVLTRQPSVFGQNAFFTVESRRLVQQGQPLSHGQRARRVGQLQGLSHGILFAHQQEHHLAPQPPAAFRIRFPDGEALALASLGPQAQADPHPAHAEALHDDAAFLQDARKGHDASGNAALGRLTGSQPGPLHEAPRLLVHGQTELRPFHVLRIDGVSRAQPGAHQLTRHPAAPLHAGHAPQGLLCQPLTDLASAAAGHEHRHAEAPHTRRHDVARQLRPQGIRHLPQQAVGKGVAVCLGQLPAVAHPHQHEPHAETVQRNAVRILGRGVGKLLADAGGLLLHACVELMLRGQTGHGIGTLAAGTFQQIQADVRHGGQQRQGLACLAHTHAMQHGHSQGRLPPPERQEKTPLPGQQFRPP